MADQYDNEKNYCRMLGHSITFKYCRMTAEGEPCRKIMDCWFEQLPIEEYMKTHFSEDQVKKIVSPPANKVTSLLDLIEKAKKSKKE